MKDDKKFLQVLIAAILLLLILSSCYSRETEKEDFYWDEKKIVDQRDSYSYWKRNEEKREGGLVLSYSNFTGKETILRFKAGDGNLILIKIDISLTRGKFKVCIIQPDMKVITIDNFVNEREVQLKTIEGEYRVVIAGIQAYGRTAIYKGEKGEKK